MNRFAAALLLSMPIVLGVEAAEANSVQGNIVLQRWKVSDKCARQAQAAFPDFTPDANAKRDASLKACLQDQALPTREPLAPGSTPSRP